jgi:actin-related protein
MTPEQIEEYKAIGEKIHTIDYTNHETESAEPLIEFIAYTSELAKAGLHPKFMSDDEKKALKNHYGDLWYEKVGYCREDVSEDDIGDDVKEVEDDVCEDDETKECGDDLDEVEEDIEKRGGRKCNYQCNYPQGGSIKDM